MATEGKFCRCWHQFRFTRRSLECAAGVRLTNQLVVMSELEHRIAVNVKRNISLSNQAHRIYGVFAYHISITNQGEHRTRLLTRHWVITDGEARTEKCVVM